MREPLIAGRSNFYGSCVFFLSPCQSLIRCSGDRQRISHLMAATPPPIPENRRKKALRESSFSQHQTSMQRSFNVIRYIGLVLIVAWVAYIVYMSARSHRFTVDSYLIHNGKVFYELENQGFELVKITDGYYKSPFSHEWLITHDCLFLFEKDNYGERVQVIVRIGQIESSENDVSDVVNEVHKLPQPITIAARDKNSSQPTMIDSFEVDSYVFTIGGHKQYFNSER